MSGSVTAQQVGHSAISTRKSSFLWKISNFKGLERKFIGSACNGCFGCMKVILQSPTFCTSSDDFKWSLLMFISTLHGSYENSYLSFKLQIENDNVKYYAIDVLLSISILKIDGEKFLKSQNCCIYRKNDDRLIHNSSSNMCYNEYVINFICIKDLFDISKGYLRNDDLHVLCEYELTSANFKDSPILTFKNQDLINRNIADTLGKQWKDQEFCDYELVARCGRRLAAHKLVLSGRSPVFQAMLKTDMQEKRDNFIQIEDISYEVLEEMLQFMYYGKISDQGLVDGVLYAAEKYQIPDLKDACKELLFNNLNVDNAENTLELCRLYDLTDLQPHVELFVNSNVK